MKVQLDPPDLCQVGIVEIPENENRIEDVVCCQNYVGTITTFTVQLWNCDLSNPENRAQKTWELDISNQTSFPKIKLSSICLDLPFAYVGKSNGVMEVWDVTKDEVIKTVDHTELLNAETHFQISNIENEFNKIVTINKTGNLFVMQKRLLKGDINAEVFGYKVNYADNINDFKVDSTCLVVRKHRVYGALFGERKDEDVLVKLDFWPIFLDNFKLKLSKPEEKDKPDKSKKRKNDCSSSSNPSAAKKPSVENEDDDGDKYEDYEYQEEDVYDYGADDDDHGQFYDDDNYGDDYN